MILAIFAALNNNKVASTCLGLTCKRLYNHHFSIHGALSLRTQIPGPDAFIRRVHDPEWLFLYPFLTTWMGPSRVYFPKSNRFIPLTALERIKAEVRLATGNRWLAEYWAFLTDEARKGEETEMVLADWSSEPTPSLERMNNLARIYHVANLRMRERLEPVQHYVGSKYAPGNLRAGAYGAYRAADKEVFGDLETLGLMHPDLGRLDDVKWLNDLEWLAHDLECLVNRERARQEYHLQ